MDGRNDFQQDDFVDKWKAAFRSKIAIGLEQVRSNQVIDGEEAVKRVLDKLARSRRADRVDAIDGLRRGIADLDAGRDLSLDEFVTKMRDRFPSLGAHRAREE